MGKNPSINCPTCKKKFLYSSTNPHRPFCSKPCSEIDLIKWADGDYKIPEKKTEESKSKPK